MPIDNQIKSGDTLILSYLSLRIVVGILGVVLPLVMLIGVYLLSECDAVQESISAYYHTGMRDFFVGIICAIAVFLFTYKGYESRDDIAGNFACVFALGVAFFPSSYFGIKTPCIPNHIDNGILDILHLASAALLFLMLAYFSFFLFTKSKGNPTAQKIKRNMLYKCCGVLILICILGIALYILILRDRYPSLYAFTPIFWLESIALWAFGISWLTKGEMILKDLEE